jgi:CheY-like chemotaxis protein/anti-sigma regulatory factor (Ser/Thr protein kinase)
VVLNLCANAVQAMRHGGRLEVTLEVCELAEPLVVATSALAAGRYLRLRVEDTGAGMPPELLRRIFDPFFTTKEVGVGTGLGLSLVHGIVADLGGGIDVRSAVGQGSCFTVYLPATAALVPGVAGAMAPAPMGQGQSILLVDDEEPLVHWGGELLAGMGYAPVAFVRSADALASFGMQPDRYDLVLSDESMPGMTGSEMCSRIRALRADIPIIIMSGFVTPALVDAARELGAAEVLNKPLSADSLARAVAQALGTLQTPPA